MADVTRSNASAWQEDVVTAGNALAGVLCDIGHHDLADGCWQVLTDDCVYEVQRLRARADELSDVLRSVRHTLHHFAAGSPRGDVSAVQRHVEVVLRHAVDRAQGERDHTRDVLARLIEAVEAEAGPLEAAFPQPPEATEAAGERLFAACEAAYEEAGL